MVQISRRVALAAILICSAFHYFHKVHAQTETSNPTLLKNYLRDWTIFNRLLQGRNLVTEHDVRRMDTFLDILRSHIAELEKTSR